MVAASNRSVLNSTKTSSGSRELGYEHTEIELRSPAKGFEGLYGQPGRFQLGCWERSSANTTWNTGE